MLAQALPPVRAAREGVALMDRSHWGRIRVTGNDRRKFLHNMTTADFEKLEVGGGLDAVLVTSTARIIDYVTAYAQPDAILLVTSPERREVIVNWLPRFIFFNDDVRVEDVTDQSAMLSLYGPQSAALLSALGVDVANLAPNASRAATIGGAETMVAAGAGLGLEGYTLVMATDQALAVQQALVERGRPRGLEVMDETAWEPLRVSQGRPRADRELTEQHNPLEAGLWHAVRFDKGCYIGQEVIARLDTYQKIKQRLMGVRLEALVEPGASVRADGEEVGTLTSVSLTENGPFGLAYVRTRAALPGQIVEVGTSHGELVEAPYLTWERTDLPA
ncbi:MAG: hypothetical protein M5U01_05905 [Ardenticatenaceae bacterium]|nr:hypothetical protein [Ardenticatenaceae bacterium]HBY98693.1 folate-binding protein YgfZ [Chloroflexota bacterium]